MIPCPSSASPWQDHAQGWAPGQRSVGGRPRAGLQGYPGAGAGWGRRRGCRRGAGSARGGCSCCCSCRGTPAANHGSRPWHSPHPRPGACQAARAQPGFWRPGAGCAAQAGLAGLAGEHEGAMRCMSAGRASGPACAAFCLNKESCWVLDWVTGCRLTVHASLIKIPSKLKIPSGEQGKGGEDMGGKYSLEGN